MADSTNRIILVLASFPGRLQEFDRFLSRRGWTIRLHSDLKSFLNDVVKWRPQYVLLSVDYEHPNMQEARRAISQTGQVHLIDFAEEQTLESWEKLKAIGHAQKIYGYLTGPALERALHRLMPQTLARREKSLSEGREEELRKGVARILEISFEKGDGRIRRALTWNTNLTCIQVKTPVLCGHFVVALGSDRALDEHLMFVVKDALVSLMKQLGYEVETTDAFPVELQKVEFKKWSDSMASFIETGVHRGIEVALAFFPTDAELFRFEKSQDPAFLKIPLNEVRSGQGVDFEIYLHLPLNGKYILYISRGGELTPQQHLGLEARGIKSLHVREEDRLGVLRTRAVQRLDRLIGDYYESRLQ
ncbi:MAG: hypothetical protein KF802_06345 [Bdellovibrionaceae bacterium]|nr:hypothetical protein [Pseudobdellovibrionaceae bacterium]MBX3032542.1 hypothetical protein [Pseudobdellovibrionaceae bacterium]